MIAFDLVAVSPMSAISGNVAYMEYIKGTTRQGGKAGDLTNNIWQLGDVDPTYTASIITERFVATEGQADFICALEPKDVASVVRAAVNGAQVPVTSVSGATIKIAAVKKGDIVTFAYRTATMEDLAQVPVETLPTLKAKLTNIALEAKPRRIAIYYSQLAAFQAKTDYGFNLSEGLAEQAVGQLSYEIDSEIVNMLKEAAKPDDRITSFSKTQPVGVSLADHYAAFAAKIEEYKMAIYN